MDIVIAGHSLGAARAALYAWSRLARGLRVDGLYLYGCPRPGNHVVARTLSQVALRSICNGRDHVTSVPFDWPLVNEEYMPVALYEMGNAPPQPGDKWGFFAWHHSELYQKACRMLPSTPPQFPVSLVQGIDAVCEMYQKVGSWAWEHFVDGEYCGMQQLSGAKLLVFRGTSNEYEWIQDFEAWQEDITLCGYTARVSKGFWEGVGPILSELDGALQ